MTAALSSELFHTVLVANRGEIAVRVIRTLRAMGIASVAVYSDADVDAPHVRCADRAVRIGPAPARDSYLNVSAVIDAARATGAQAIHPGYGFLSENPTFAHACRDAGIVFIGPPVEAIEAMGDKIAARHTVSASGVSIVPGRDGTDLDDDALMAAALDVGLPVMLKPTAGGGGKGMRLVERAEDLPAAIASARREAASSFGNDTLLIERYVTRPRHIEIQVLADTHGNVVHFGERECSLQRRHQKIIEEAPSVLLTPAVREAMGAQAAAAARSCGYVGAGTVEFIVSADRPEEFFFMEMNTRLQVEHPVTEMIFGVDLVEQQVRVAAGERLPFEQNDLRSHGHAIEARVYAEDPSRGFLPTGGRVVGLALPSGDGVRVDAGIGVGTVVGSDYDPMLAKVIAHGADRADALARLDRALSATLIAGVTTNVPFLRNLLADPDVQAGRLDTTLVERRLDDLVLPGSPKLALEAAAAELRAELGGSDPWSALVGWRHGRREPVQFRLTVDGGEPASVAPPADLAANRLVHRTGDGFLVVIDGGSWRIDRAEDRGRPSEAMAGGVGRIVSPMPGTVVAVHVVVGDDVIAGQAVAVVEAMKMEHTLTAPADATVADVHVTAGQTVALDAPLVTLIPRGEPS